MIFVDEKFFPPSFGAVVGSGINIQDPQHCNQETATWYSNLIPVGNNTSRLTTSMLCLYLNGLM
jgi:hypothetical protein